MRADLARQGEDIRTRLADPADTDTDTDTAAATAKTVADLAGRVAEYVRRSDEAIDLSAVDPAMGVGALRAAEEIYALLTKDVQRLVSRTETLRAERIQAAEKQQVAMLLGLTCALISARSMVR